MSLFKLAGNICIYSPNAHIPTTVAVYIHLQLTKKSTKSHTLFRLRASPVFFHKFSKPNP